MSENPPRKPPLNWPHPDQIRRAYQQACGDGPDDDPQFKSLSDCGPDMQAYLERKRREAQSEFERHAQDAELRQVEREAVARAAYAGSLTMMAAGVLRAALEEKPAPRERLEALLALDLGAEAFVRTVRILLASYAAEFPLEALELLRFLDAIEASTFRDEDEE